jgi:hypothetical protein
MNSLRCHRRAVVVWFACSLLIAVATATVAAWAPTASDGQWLVYFGTYTGPKSRGIYVASFDGASGNLGEPRLAAETENPSFLALHPSHPLLYAVNEVDKFEGQRAGSVTAFAVDPATGDLRALGASRRAERILATSLLTAADATSWSRTTAEAAWPACPSAGMAAWPRPRASSSTRARAPIPSGRARRMGT